MRHCERCGSDENIEEHHYHPKFANNIKGEGEKKLLCKNKCHLPLHVRLSGLLWKYIEPHNRLLVINEIKSFTDKWIDEGKEKQTLSYIQTRIHNSYLQCLIQNHNLDNVLFLFHNLRNDLYCCSPQPNQDV